MLDALAEQHIHPCILKGTALAYWLYDSPSDRPRVDADLLIRHEDADSVRRVMTRLGYNEPPYCDGALVSRQFTMGRRDRVQGSISSSTCTGRSATSRPSPICCPSTKSQLRRSRCRPSRRMREGPDRSTRCCVACVHPVMHHSNVEWLLWSHDVHLIASRLSATEWCQFADLASARRVSTVCAHQLNVARRWFATASARLGDGATRRGRPRRSDGRVPAAESASARRSLVESPRPATLRQSNSAGAAGCVSVTRLHDAELPRVTAGSRHCPSSVPVHPPGRGWKLEAHVSARKLNVLKLLAFLRTMPGRASCRAVARFRSTDGTARRRGPGHPSTARNARGARASTVQRYRRANRPAPSHPAPDERCSRPR